MIWEEFRNRYLDFELSVLRTVMMNLLAAINLKGFPKCIAPGAAEPIMRAANEVQRVLLDIDEEGRGTSELHHRDSEGSDPSKQLQYVSHRMLITAQLSTPKTSADRLRLSELEHIPWNQELVMVMAHLDAFLTDCIQAVCRVKPDALRCRKEIDYDSIISCGGWDELLERMIDKHSYDAGEGSLKNRVSYMRKRLRIDLEFSADCLDVLEEAEAVRHIIVHNGCRIDRRFMKKTNRDDLTVGEMFHVSPQFVDKVADRTMISGFTIFAATAKSLFGRGGKELGVYQPTIQPEQDKK